MLSGLELTTVSGSVVERGLLKDFPGSHESCSNVIRDYKVLVNLLRLCFAKSF